MSKAVEEAINQTCSESDDQAARINSLIKELTELREAIAEHKKYRDYYRSHLTVVQGNIQLGKTKYRGLQNREIQLRSAISEAIKSIELNDKELKNLHTTRLEEWSKRCDKLKIETAKYADYFVRAQTEYSKKYLTKDIEAYRIECNKMNEELSTMKRKLENLKNQIGYNCLNTNEEFGGSEDLRKIDNLLNDVKLNDNNTLHEIALINMEMQKIQTEIKQKKAMLDGLK